MGWDDIDYLLLKIPLHLRKRTKPIGLAIAFCSMGFLGLTDYLTGYELSFSIFYLIPISAITLIGSGRWGVLASIVAASAWLTADQWPQTKDKE